MPKSAAALSFELFASFKRIETGNPILALPPLHWAAATHAMVVGDTVHYIWCPHARCRKAARKRRALL